MEHTIVQLMIQWGYLGIFLSALLAGSILPFSSELVLVVLVRLGLNPVGALFCAALGNTAGGMTCYYMGMLGKLDWIEKHFGVKHEKIEKMKHFLKGRGACMAFFAFLPFIGEAISITLGFMRSNQFLTITSMFIGKLLRYIAILYALNGIIDSTHIF